MVKGGGGSRRAKTPPESKEARELYKVQADISRSMFDDYKAFGRPHFERLSAEAMEDPSARINQATGLAAADVGRSYDMAEGGLRRSLGRYGMRPGSGRFASSLRALALGRAADTAGAKTGARMGVLDRLRSTRMALAGMGQSSAGMGIRGIAAAGSGLGQLAGMRYQADAAAARNRSNMWGGLMRLGGTLGSAAILASDRRLKHAIVEIGELPKGIKVYEFSFLGMDGRYTGVMADEVAKVMPEHVYRMENGYLGVDYAGMVEECWQ